MPDYRYMANEVRDLVPLLLHPQAAADLRSLADYYERLARYVEELPTTLPNTPSESTGPGSAASTLSLP